MTRTLPVPRSPPIDPRTGLLGREWTAFFGSLMRLAAAGGDDLSVALAMQPDRAAEIDDLRHRIADLEALVASVAPTNLGPLIARIDAIELQAAMIGSDPFVSRKPING